MFWKRKKLHNWSDYFPSRKFLDRRCHQKMLLFWFFGSFHYFWKFLVFPALPTCEVGTSWWTIVGDFTKRCRKLFVSRKKFVTGSFWCFWKFLVSENYALSRFFIESFCLKLFAEGAFWCLWVLAVLSVDWTCMLHNNMPRKTFKEKSRNFVVILRKIIEKKQSTYRSQHFIS